jgi:hypothetical protein
MAITNIGVTPNPADNGSANEPTTLALDRTALTHTQGNLLVLVGVQRIAGGAAGITLGNAGGQTWEPAGTFDTGIIALSAQLWIATYNGTWTADPSVAFAAQSGTVSTSAFLLVAKPTTTDQAWALDAYADVGYAAPSTPFTVSSTPGTPNHPDNITYALWCSVDDNTWDTPVGLTQSGASLYYRNTAGSDMSVAIGHQIQDGAAVGRGTLSMNQVANAGDAGVKLLICCYVVTPHGPIVGGGQLTKGALIRGGRLVV